MTTNDDYEITLIDNEADVRTCAKLLCEAFASDNSLTRFTQATAQHLFDVWLYSSMHKRLNERLSFLMRYRPTNEIVAAIYATDLFRLSKEDPYDASAPVSDPPDGDLYHEMFDQFVHHDFGEELKPNMVLYMAVVGTRSDYAGKGLVTRLNGHVCEYARSQRGYQYVFVQTTHPATRHLYVKRMNGEETRVVDPATWVRKQETDGPLCPLKGYVGEPVVNILVKL